jgi:tyrosinase
LRRRKEISDVTDEEFDRFAAALNTLKKAGHWDSITQLHGNAVGTAHGTDQFLHWHRMYLFDLETMLQAAANSCEVTLPYWNWALDFEDSTNQAVWGPNRYGSLDIQGEISFANLYEYNILPAWLPPAIPFFASSPGRIVSNGKFGPGSEFDNADRQTPILRNWAQVPVSGVSIQTLQRQLEIVSDRNINIPEEFPMLNNLTGWNGFVNVLEQFHGRMHGVIGGFMGGLFTSSYDPIFFAHHAHIDKIWKDWQDTHLDVEGDERFFASDMVMGNLLCGQAIHDDHSGVEGVDVEVSTHMTGSMNGAVDYLEREDDFGCGADWEMIQCCMKSITDANMWDQVARIQTGDETVTDVCSPLNPNERTATEIWLATLVHFNALTQSEAFTALEGSGHLLMPTMPTMSLDAVEQFDQFGHYAVNLTAAALIDETTTQCEQRLCIAVTTGLPKNTLRSVCARADTWNGRAGRCI